MRQKHIVAAFVGIVLGPDPRRVNTQPVAQEAEAEGLVKGRPEVDLRKSLKEELGVLQEVVYNLSISPVELLWQIPVKNRHHRRDASGCQIFENVPVEGYSLRIRLHLPVLKRHHTRPGDGEPVRVEAVLRDQAQVPSPSVVVVVSFVATAPLPCSALVAEDIPNAFGPAAFVEGTFYLVGGGGYAPPESWVFAECVQEGLLLGPVSRTAGVCCVIGLFVLTGTCRAGNVDFVEHLHRCIRLSRHLPWTCFMQQEAAQ
mmetsp:Transcript_34870/g.80318  ORF Transcript_34870/g.80318 Transcript_34870/m.80318 type:complete len:258 (+) Transcript_34870:759-1532(+)